MSPKHPKTRAKATAAALKDAIATLEACAAEHSDALEGDGGDELERAAHRAAQEALAALQSAAQSVARVQISGEWTAQRALDALADVKGLEARLVEAPAASEIPHYVELDLPRGGLLRIASRALTDGQPGFVLGLHAHDAGPGDIGSSLVADDDDRLRSLVSVLRG